MFRFTICKPIAAGIALAVALITATPKEVLAWPEAVGGIDPRTGKYVRGVRLLDDGKGKKPVKKPQQKPPASWDVF